MKRFNALTMVQLKKACDEGKLVTINGVNSLGQEFTTTGRITHTDQGKQGVDEDKVWLEFGKSKTEKRRKQTKWFAPYSIVGVEGNYHRLFALSIEIDGQVIFENENKEEILAQCEQRAEKEQEYIRNRGLDKLPKGKFMQDFLAQVGKPVTIDGETGVLHSCKGTTINGDPSVILLSGPISGHLALRGLGKSITVEDNDGKPVVVAQMDIEYANEKFKIMNELYNKQKS